MPVDPGPLQAKLRDWSLRVMTQTVTEMPRLIQGYAPQVTGQLRQSVGVGAPATASGDTVEARVVATAPQAGWTNDGTVPHVIRPKKWGGVLVFDVGGEKVFTREVHHPGNRGTHWWDRALQATWMPTLRNASLRNPFR